MPFILAAEERLRFAEGRAKAIVVATRSDGGDGGPESRGAGGVSNNLLATVRCTPAAL